MKSINFCDEVFVRHLYEVVEMCSGPELREDYRSSLNFMNAMEEEIKIVNLFQNNSSKCIPVSPQSIPSRCAQPCSFVYWILV